MTDYFGKTAGFVISILYFLAIVPIVLIYGVSITNTIHGTEDMTPPAPTRNPDFPLAGLAANPQTPRCSAGQVTNPQFADRLYRWQPGNAGFGDWRPGPRGGSRGFGLGPGASCPRCRESCW